MFKAVRMCGDWAECPRHDDRATQVARASAARAGFGEGGVQVPNVVKMG